MEEILKKEIEKQLCEEYENIKVAKLEEINRLFEYKKQEIIAGILNGISIEISRNEFGIEPNINIHIRTTRTIKREE